jgi:hypothetical protein
MSKRQIIIDFDFSPEDQLASEQSLVARVRALGEDLFREFRKNGEAILDIRDSRQRNQPSFADPIFQ